MTYVVIIVIAVVICAGASLLSGKISVEKYKNDVKEKNDKARDEAKDIINKAIRDAEEKKRILLLEAKEDTIKQKKELDQEIRERRAEISNLERRNITKEETLEKKENELNNRERDMKNAKKLIDEQAAKAEELLNRQQQELEIISGYTKEQAKQELLDALKDELTYDTAKIIKSFEIQIKDESEKIAKQHIISAIQRCAADCVSEATVSIVELPNDEIKGRIIGREGRNIRTLETLTGVEVIIDDTPEAVILSSFDPIRREVCNTALSHLILDGRIHPSRIEEVVEKSKREINSIIKQKGEEAIFDLGITGLHPELVRLLGRMHYRTSYGQNALQHSIEVAKLSAAFASELGEDERMAIRAGIMHDIGKSIDREIEGTHVEIGANLCKKYGEPRVVIDAVESHHGDKEPESVIACIVQAADAISAARPGARQESVEDYANRLQKLEEVANGFEGVEKSFAVQAGREIRVMVVPEKVTDDQMTILAREISKKIESDLTYPGQIKINVIREKRITEVAR